MDQFHLLPEASRALWAKSGSERGHGLLAHMLDVAAVAVEVMNRESNAARRTIAAEFGLPADSLVNWLALLVGLHDFGKGIPGFQRKWDAGRAADEAAGLLFSAASTGVDRHDYASAALLRDLLVQRGVSDQWAQAVSRAIGAHHGYVPSTSEIKSARPLFESTTWRQARSALFEAYWSAVAPSDMPFSTAEIRLPAVAWLGGLTSLCDWIGSNEAWFSPGERADSIREHFENARGLARGALNEIGWSEFHSLLNRDESVDAVIGRVIGRGDATVARPLQRVADRMLSGISEPALMIVEAPMGEGKTELAFLVHLRLQKKFGHRGLYLALPTQATGNAAFDRSLIFLRAYSGEVRLDIQLAHGGAALDERVQKLRGVNASSTESVSSSAWFSQSKRALLSPYGVGTVDQALFATLNVKHHFVRLWGLANRVVVLDEIHAYDTYTSGLIVALLRWLRAMRCSVVLMSATLPAARKGEFLTAWSAQPGLSNPPHYPRITVATCDGVVAETFACRAQTPIRVVSVAESIDAVAQCALTAVAAGGCGAVIVNTVQRAQDLYVKLKSCITADTEVLLFHARYPADERRDREQTVIDRFGRHGSRPESALLIATQVVEQSLDIDFDFLITDLAPVDLLLQRAGRLHRHERRRPAAHEVPILTVAGFDVNRLPELRETKWRYVYDAYILYRTWIFAAHESVWKLPDDIDRFVQAVYSDMPLPEDLSEEIGKEIDAAWCESVIEHQNQQRLALNAAIDATDVLQNAYLMKPRGNEDGIGLGIQNKTRLGDDGLTVIPVHVTRQGWKILPNATPFDPERPIDDDLARQLFRRQLRISRKDLAVPLSADSTPAGLSEHPLLQYVHWLRLTDNCAKFGSLEVALSTELGITYRTISSNEEAE